MTTEKEDTTVEETITFPLSDDEMMLANKKLSALVRAASEALEEAEKYADKYHLSFSWSPAYGMGGHYNGNPDDRNPDDEGGWSSSSAGC